MKDPDNLIEIRRGITAPAGMPGPDEPPLQPRRKEGGDPATVRCEHLGVWLDLEERAVSCKRCGAVVDAFEHLLDLAERWDRISRWVRHAQRTRAQVEIQVAKLKAEKKRLQDAVRRLEKKVGRVARTKHREGLVVE